jgi:hypothetical protein
MRPWFLNVVKAKRRVPVFERREVGHLPRRRHLVGHRAGDDQQIRLPGP